MGLKKLITGALATIIIGGSAYTVSQTDIVNNFADDTGMTQEQAEEYVNNINENELTSFNELGDSLISDSKVALDTVNQIDCVNYEYEWQSSTLTCEGGKSQLREISENERLLGTAYIKLNTDSASKEDIEKAIEYIDKLNLSYSLEIVGKVLDDATINESKQSNSYNKAILKAALDSN